MCNECLYQHLLINILLILHTLINTRCVSKDVKCWYCMAQRVWRKVFIQYLVLLQCIVEDYIEDADNKCCAYKECETVDPASADGQHCGGGSHNYGRHGDNAVHSVAMAWLILKFKRMIFPQLNRETGGRLNIKMLSYQYRDSHVKDKTVSSTVLSLTWESPYLEKTVFILRRAPGSYLMPLTSQHPFSRWLGTERSLLEQMMTMVTDEYACSQASTSLCISITYSNICHQVRSALESYIWIYKKQYNHFQRC